ncbi:MAG: ChaN family lipoprotein [Bacteroidota bacterium]
MKTYIFTLMGLFFPVFLFAQYDAYLVYNAKGKKVDFTKVIQKVSEADVIFFGESHDNPISHWLELKLIKDLPELTDGKLVVGVEMFEADDQLIIDEYFAGYYDDSRFEQEAKLWKNYQTDYKPLLLAARETGIPFVATNIPRRYANMVSKKGFEVLEDLSDQARQWMAPLPVPYDPDLPVYRDMLEMSMGHGHVSENFPKAQAIKDATMAHFISENLKAKMEN